MAELSKVLQPIPVSQDAKFMAFFSSLPSSPSFLLAMFVGSNKVAGDFGSHALRTESLALALMIDAKPRLPFTNIISTDRIRIANRCSQFATLILERRFLRPIDFLDASDDETTKSIDSDKTTSEKEVLELVKSFYAALTTGDQDALESIYSQSNSEEVSEVRTMGKFIRKVCIIRCRVSYS